MSLAWIAADNFRSDVSLRAMLRSSLCVLPVATSGLLTKIDRLFRVVFLCVALTSSGCVNMKSMWNGLMDPSQVGHFGGSPLPGEIRKTLTIHEDPPGVPGAEDPLPEDLTVSIEDYQIGPGDTVQIAIYELLERRRYEPLVRTITESGQIQIPVLGWIDGVDGLTVRQLQEVLVDRLSRDILAEPLVEVLLMDRRQRTFSITGGVAIPNEYRIIRNNYRLTDALAVAGGADADLKEVYVYRAAPATTSSPKSTSPESADATQSEPAVAAPPTAPSATQPAGDEDAQHELLEAAAPVPAPPQPTGPAGPASQDTKWQWVDGQWREIEVTAPAGERPPREMELHNDPNEDQIDWEALASSGRQRIIRIRLDRLRNGDERYNIVIRTGDRIWVPLGQIGDFYMMGHVNQPGVYSLSRRQVTIRQAIAASGGLSQLAWPSRCELIRRVGGDREIVIPFDLSAIFDGQEEDFLLRPDDVINIGTAAVAPFLATIRSAFRVAYGFGFVYDRNFADIDAYGPQQNPTARRRFDRQRRFPGLF